jgi:hypothetical protein
VRLLVTRVATPELLRVELLISVLPWKNETVPVGTTPETGVTFAVKVTFNPNVDGLGDVVSVVVVATST